MALFWARSLARAAHGQEFFAPFLADFGRIDVVILGQRLDDGIAGRPNHLNAVAMGAADRLGDDADR